MRVAHFCGGSTYRSGMTMTVHDINKAQLKMGIDSGIVYTHDFIKGSFENGGDTFEGVCSKPLSWAKKADVIVMSSTIPLETWDWGIPIVFINHGMPQGSILMEIEQNDSVYSTALNCLNNPLIKKTVTFWREHLRTFKKYTDNIVYVPHGIELERYNWPCEPFHTEGNPNVIIASMWRYIKNPYNHIVAMSELKENGMPGIKLNCLGFGNRNSRSWRTFLHPFLKSGLIGEFGAMTPNLPLYFKGGDFCVEPVTGGSRILKEAMICGLPVLANEGCEWTDYTCNPDDYDSINAAVERLWSHLQNDREKVKQKTYQIAKDNFDVRETARQLVEIYKEVIGCEEQNS